MTQTLQTLIRKTKLLVALKYIMLIDVHANFAMRTNIDIDNELMMEAFRLTDVKTKKELVHLALVELVKAKKKKNLLDLTGKIQFHEGYDHKAQRGS